MAVALVAQQTADNTAQVAGLFHHVVDVLAGLATSDDSAAWMRTDGQAGPVNSGGGYYVGADGNLYPRGINSAATATAPTAAAGPAPAGLVLPPGLLLLGVLFLLLRK